MRENDIRAKQAKKFVPTTTDSKHNLPIADNLLDRQFARSKPNEAWVADITYIPTAEGWLYLAAIMDLCSRKIVGWAISDRATTELPLRALHMAVQRRRPPNGLLHHSDRGTQYASWDYQRALQKHGMVCSMSRKGNCYDNAPMESWFHSLKGDVLPDRPFPTKRQATSIIFEYIEAFYNRRRIHSALRGLSPAAYEERLLRAA